MDRDSFDRLLLDHLAAAQRFAIRLAGDPHLAEDLLHDAIVRAVRACEGFRGEAKFTSWLFQIIVNCFRDRLRAKKISELPEEPLEAPAIDPAADSAAAELGQLVARRVSSLPARQREVLVLLVYEKLSVAETARVLEISEQSVRTSLFHARERLKRELAVYLTPSYRGI